MIATKFKKIVFFFIFSVFFINTAPSYAQDIVSARIIAKVNGGIITSKELSDRVNLIVKTSNINVDGRPDLKKRLVLQVLQSLIDETLQIQIARKENINVRIEEIVQSKRQLFKGKEIEEIDNFLVNNKISKQTLNRQIEANISWGKYVGKTYRKRSKTTKADILEKVKLLLRGESTIPSDEKKQALAEKVAIQTRQEELKLLSDELMHKIRSSAMLDVNM